MTIKFCKTEKDLKDLVIRCYSVKMKQHAEADRAVSATFDKQAIAIMIKNDEILSVTNVRYAITHTFRMLHRAVYALAAYPELLQLSKEYDYLERHGVWFYVDEEHRSRKSAGKALLKTAKATGIVP